MKQTTYIRIGLAVFLVIIFGALLFSGCQPGYDYNAPAGAPSGVSPLPAFDVLSYAVDNKYGVVCYRWTSSTDNIFCFTFEELGLR